MFDYPIGSKTYIDEKTEIKLLCPLCRSQLTSYPQTYEGVQLMCDKRHLINVVKDHSDFWLGIISGDCEDYCFENHEDDNTL